MTPYGTPIYYSGFHVLLNDPYITPILHPEGMRPLPKHLTASIFSAAGCTEALEAAYEDTSPSDAYGESSHQW